MAAQPGNPLSPDGLPPEHETVGSSDTVLKLDRPEPGGRAGSLPADPVIGLVLANRYRIEQRLGVGGMGAVYRAVHVHMKNTVALKVLHPQMTHVAEAVARFEREAVAAARIEHPNVAKATDFGRLHDGSFYMALEFVEGQSLREVLKSGPLPTARAVNIVRQIAEALQAAHEQGVVHRDLKPENVMLQAKGKDQVKVLDFGIAKVALADPLPGDSQLTKAGAVFGTPDYMSPEQAGGKDVDHRTDLYALGILTYELLSGSVPFSGDSIAAILVKHLQEEPPAFPPQIDWRVAALVQRMLAKDPVARPASARAVADELMRLRLSLVPERPASNPLMAALGKAQRAIVLLDLGTKLRRAVAFCRAFARAIGRRWPATQVLGKELALGPLRVTLATLLASTVGGLLLLWLVLSLRSSPEPVAKTEAPAAVPSAEEAPAAQATEAPVPPNPELEALIAMPVYKRKIQDWQRLAKLHTEARQWSESVAAYRNAFQLDRNLVKDPVLLQTFRGLVLKRESYEAASNVAVNLLGEPGLDLLYDVWLEVKADKKQRILSDFLAKQLEIHHSRRASKALKVALDLEFRGELECEPVKKIVLQAIKSADTRSVAGLNALEVKNGCGFDKQQDCFACLREGGDLEAALQTATESAAPRFDGTRYVPGR
jgi:eukaryotic-like serine/threonine-protein kinase